MFKFLNQGHKLMKIPSGIIALVTLAVLAAVITTLALSNFTAEAQGNSGAVANLQLTSTSAGELTVSWDAASPTPTDYRVDWAKSTEDYPSWKVDDGHVYTAETATTTTITDLSHDTEYKIRLRARYYRGEHEGKSWGGPWATATITVTGEPAETVQQPPKEDPTQQPARNDPDPPAGTIETLTAADDTGQLLLTWEAPAAPNATPTDYHINWAKSTEEYPANTASAGNDHPTSTTHTLAGLKYDIQYNIRVRARYSDGENTDSPWNGPWTETTAQVKLPLPAAPFIGAIAVSPDGDVLLSWFNLKEDDSITGYQILRGPDADSLVVIEDDTGSSSTSYTDETPPAGQTHTYAVKARNASGLSPVSNTLTATVPEALITARHESTGNTLVSNLGQTFSAEGAIAGIHQERYKEHAIAFTTGANPLGYHVTTAQLTVKEFPGKDTPNPDVSIRADDRGVPGETVLYTLTATSAVTGSWNLLTFTTTDNFTLRPNTTYWLYATAMGTNTMLIRGTESDVEDTESNTDWRIGDARYSRDNGGTWTQWDDFNLWININGHAAPEFLVSNLDSPSTLALFSRRTDADRSKFAQAFSAANNENGTPAEFDFDGVTVQLESAFSTASQLADSDIVVTVHKDSGGQPGDLVYTLTSPETYTVPVPSAPVTFSAPPGSILSSGITYWVKFEIADASTFFTGLTRIDFEFATDNNQVQGPTTYNRWTIGHDSLWSPQTLSWATDVNSIKISVLGTPRYDTLVSNIDQTFLGAEPTGPDVKAAQSFLTPPGPLGQQYRLNAARFNASSQHPTHAMIDLHADDNGVPGDHLASMTMPGDFAPGDTVIADLTVSAPKNTNLNTGTRYWFVITNEQLNNPLYLRVTESKAQDSTSLNGWTIGDRRAKKEPDQPWSSVAFPIQIEVLGTPFIRTNEADGPDLPGAGHNAHQTGAVVIPGIVSTGHLTPGLDRNHGHSGDYWWLETQRGHRYRVEVKFGDNPNNDTGGSAWMSFIDPDHHDYPYASGCCEADHNRDDGHTFVHFYRPTDDWNNRYLINVAAFDKLNHNSRIYNGPYTITMTDITGTEKVATNLYLGTRIESTLPTIDESVKYAVSFTTGDHSAGYKLDRVRIHVPYHEALPNLVLHDDASGLPGDGICDLLEPNKVQHHRPYTADNPLPVPFRAAHCGSEAFLDANTTYWLVLEGTDYETVFTDSSDQQTRGSGWTIGDRAATSLVGSWGNLASNWGTIPVEIWANKLNNPLSVSLEVTSDPTHGTDSDTYGAGDVITFEVKFTEAVTITGAPRLRFKISGTGDDYAPYLSGSGTNTLVFAYTVLATDADTNGIFLYNRPLSYPDADADTIVAVDDNLPVIDKITGQIRTLSGHKIDGTITN